MLCDGVFEAVERAEYSEGRMQATMLQQRAFQARTCTRVSRSTNVKCQAFNISQLFGFGSRPQKSVSGTMTELKKQGKWVPHHLVLML